MGEEEWESDLVMKTTLSALYKAVIAVAAAAGILLQCGVASGRMELYSFRMFTTLSNLAVLLFFLWDVIRLCRGAERSSTGAAFKFLITMGIMLTGLVAHFMLRGMFTQLAGGEKIGITLLHYVVPIMTVLDYFLFDPKGQTKKWMPCFAALFPICYAVYALISAQWMTGEDRYPYPFLNADMLGWGQVFLNMVLLAAAYFAVGFLVCLLDRKLGKMKRNAGDGRKKE